MKPPSVRLRAFIKAEGISQREMAARLDISDATMSELLNRATLPSLALAARIQDHCGIPARDWMPS